MIRCCVINKKINISVKIIGNANNPCLLTLDVDVQVTYDKPFYYPGDWVTATVRVNGKPHGRARQIMVFLESVEETVVRVREGHHDFDGDYHSSTRTYRDSRVYNQVFQEVPLSGMVDSTVTLRYQLPPFPSAVLDIPQHIHVFHGIRFKQDIRLGSDDIRFFPLNMVPFTPADLNAVLPNEIRDQVGRFWIGNVNLFSGDLVSWMFETAPDLKYRGLRVELEWSLHVMAKGRRENTKNKMVIARFKTPPNPFPPLQMPQLPISTVKGYNFSISAALKLVVDRAFASDFNYIIPVNLFEPPRNLAGGIAPAPVPMAVGTHIDDVVAEAKFCENCGNKLEVGDRFCRSCGFDVVAAK